MANPNVVAWTLHGRQVEVDLHDINGAEWAEAKRAFGWGWLSEVDLIDRALRSRDLEAIASVVWVWLRRSDPEVTYEATLQTLSFGSTAT